MLALALVFSGLLPTQTLLAAPHSATYFTVPLSGAAEVPSPGDSDGTGVAHLALDPVGGTVCYVINVDNVAPIAAGHIHQGAEDASGGVAIALFGDAADAAQGCATADAATINAIIANPADYYVNLHNADFAAGAVRGQLDQAATTFTVTIENVSGNSALPGPFAPGVFAIHNATTEPFFTMDMPDRGDGLEALAEDGGAAALAGVVAGTAGVSSSSVFSIPVGADGPGPIFPGGAYRFQVMAGNGDHLSLATMLVQSNDVFVAPAPAGIALFNGDGTPISGDVTDQFPLWDAGTEANEAPGMGPNQAPRQVAADTGSAEGGVTPFSNSTRSVPLAGGLVDVSVAEVGGTFTFSVTNISGTFTGTTSALDTPIAPIFYATHNAEWALFSGGAAASAGLESLAEDGSPAALVGEHTGAVGTGMVGAQPMTVERPGDGPGPSFTGESYTFAITPTIEYPNMSLAAMVVQSNDAFLAFGSKGVALLDPTGAPRSTDAILADINRELAVWDAGTEANEVPGVGVNQAPRQTAANTGDVDPTAGVRIYSDSTNDLAGENAGGFGTIVVANSAITGTFDITLTNTSSATVYPGVLTPMAYAVHSGDAQLFAAGQPASAGLQSLAEDGDPTALAGELGTNPNVFIAGVADTPVGAGAAGPLPPGSSYSTSVSANAANPFLSVASMIVPSNDTFFAFEPAGLRVINEDGTPRTDEEIAADIAAARLAWDAGTERNQAGAGGPDQAPRQAGPNTGADEGSGTVTLISSDTVWDYPESSDVVRIVVEAHPVVNMFEAEAALPADTERPATTFTVRVENISGDSDIPGPFAPGVWANHDASRPLFSNNQPDRGQGLEGLAEDGAAADLGAALGNRAGVASSGIFNTPTAAADPGPIFPGDAYEFEFTTAPTATRLSLATMFVQSNDVFAAPAAEGLLLFDSDGNPISGDITDQLPLWDAGTEVNEAPGMGPNQAPRQGGPNTGAHEGGVSAFTNGTRSLPLAGGIVDVDITETDGTFTVTITNTSAASGALDTPVAPIFYATHNDTWSLFAGGSPASAGLESLAEDGSPAALVGEHTGITGTNTVAAQPVTVQRPADPAGPAAPGESFQFSVTPTTTHPYLSIAAMVVQSNDAFLAFSADGVALLNSDGSPRATADILADVNRELAVWDAGTEANEVPGVGPNQAPRQAAANTGPADPMTAVRFYSDSTNDLAGSQAGGFANMTIEHGPMPLSFVVTISNTSGSTVYPGALTPVAYATHNDLYQLFAVGESASAGLEALSEDGSPSALHGEFINSVGVGHNGVQPVPVGGSAAGPILDGGAYRFMVMPDAAHPNLSVASMIVPSNDTFLAFGGQGIRLLDENGARRSEADIAADIASDLIAWDAGTERNQAGAGGPDQAPRQAGPNTGADEGSGNVTLISSDSVWDYPNSSDVLRVTITPKSSELNFKVFLPFFYNTSLESLPTP